jgi:hypothetical protein
MTAFLEGYGDLANVPVRHTGAGRSGSSNVDNPVGGW